MKKYFAPYFVQGKGIFVPGVNKYLSLTDSFSGRMVEFSDAEQAGAPSRLEWLSIMDFKEEINQLLMENGGVPLKEDYYWTSTPLDNKYAFLICVKTKGIATSFREGGNFLVRAFII